MAWDYAELSKAAKAAVGPEKLIDTIISESKAAGRNEMKPAVLIALGVGAGICWGVSQLVNHFKQKKAISQQALEEAKAEIIKGIKDYDAAHPETSNVDDQKATTISPEHEIVTDEKLQDNQGGCKNE